MEAGDVRAGEDALVAETLVVWCVLLWLVMMPSASKREAGGGRRCGVEEGSGRTSRGLG